MMIKAMAVALSVAVGGCAATTGPVINTSKVPTGQNMQADLEACRLAADGDSGNVLASNNVLNSAVNAVIHSVMLGRISPYTVSGVAQRGTTAAIQSDTRRARLIESCMKRAGWQVY